MATRTRLGSDAVPEVPVSVVDPQVLESAGLDCADHFGAAMPAATPADGCGTWVRARQEVRRQ